MKHLALSLIAFAFVTAAHAQLPKPHVTGNLPADIAADKADLAKAPTPGAVVANTTANLQALWQKIITASNADLTYAAALAKNANTASSQVRGQCWNAIITLNEQANGANLKNADGTPMTKPDPALFTNVESLAEVVDNLSPQGALFTSCAGAAELFKTDVLTFINAAVTGAAGLAALPAGLALP